jgi:glycosyltransferase involved in cell wall biosynthesis
VSMKLRFDLRAVIKVARILREGGYRIVHGHTARTAMVAGLASALTGVPMVHHAHSPSSHDTTHRWRDRINGFVERMSLRRATRVIAVSQAMADHVVHEGFDPERITVVPNGVPCGNSLPFRSKPLGAWTLGTVALFRPRKGLEILLEAMALLHRRGMPVQLRAVGTFESPKYEMEIAVRVRQLQLNGHVVWTDFTRNVPAELRKMDVFVLPSLFGEGLPMVVLEAMAAGTPIVATSVSGTPEAVRHTLDGLLVEAGNAEALAGAIAEIVEGRYDWAALRASAFERQVRLFSDAAMAAGVAAVYRELLEK